MRDYRFEDLSEGLTESFDLVVTQEQMDMFLRLSGDSNPLHCDRKYAVSHNFKDRVVYGLLTASFYSTLIGVYLPGRRCLLQGIEIAFQKPVYVGERLTISGTVKYVNEAFRQIEILGTIANQLGERVSKAKIKVGVL